jgi:hypothetical protein
MPRKTSCPIDTFEALEAAVARIREHLDADDSDGCFDALAEIVTPLAAVTSLLTDAADENPIRYGDRNAEHRLGVFETI